MKKPGLLCLLSLVLILTPLHHHAQELREFKVEELKEENFRAKTRKIFHGLDALETDTVFFYAAELLEQLEEGRLTPSQSIDVYMVIGHVFNRLNSKSIAHQFINRAYKLYQTHRFGPSHYQIQMYGMLSATLPEGPGHDEATIQYYQKGFAAASLIGLPLQMAGNLNNIGLTYARMGDYEMAGKYYERSMTIYETEVQKFAPLELAIRNNMAWLEIEKGNYERALELFTLNRNIATQDSLLRGSERESRRVSSSLGMARAHMALEEFDESEQLLIYADSIINSLSFIQYLEFTNLSHELWLDLAYKTKSKEELLAISNEFLALKDSLNDLKLEFSSNVLDALGDAQLEAANLKIQTERNDIRESRLHYGLFLAGALIIALIAAIGFLIARRKSQNASARERLSEANLLNAQLNEEKLNLELRNQSKDLNDLAGQLVFIRDLNTQINERLSNISKLKVEDQKAALSELSRLSTRNLQEIEIKGMLQENLERVNSKFYRQLDKLTNYSITKGEKEIAAMMRLGLSDIQISDLRGTTISAVRVSRHRIKQKMKLESNRDLNGYLLELPVTS